MRRLFSISFITIIAITVMACGGSSTGPDTDDSDNNNNEPETYSVSVDMTPSDGGAVSPSLEDNYEEGKEIQLLANPEDDYVFSGWTGDMEGDVNPLPLTVSQDFDITANFERKNYELSVSTEGEGSVQENVLEQKSKEYEHGTAVELIATPAKGYNFVEWTGDVESTDNPAEITVDDPKEVTAVFEKKSYELTVTTQGSGAVSEQVVSKAKDYEYGDVVELDPSAAEGWKFIEWSGDLSGSDNPAQVTVDTAKTVTAVFERKTFAMDITIQGQGTIAKNPDQSEYEYGDKVTLTADPIDGWSFKEWGGEISGSYPEMEITINSQKDIMAVFEKKSYDLTVTTDGKGSVTEETVQAKSYNHGTTVKLTAVPTDGWRFVEWEGDITGTDNPAQLTVDNPKEVTAVFKPLFYMAKNGVTVVCPDAEAGQKGILNGEDYGTEYEAVDRSSLDQMIDNKKDVTTGICTSPISDMSKLLENEVNFNQDISSWDVSNVTEMDSLFYNASSFNQDIGKWNVGNVTNMNGMFRRADNFNNDINSWDVSSVTDMNRMFSGATAFNQYIDDWDVSSVLDMSAMFHSAGSFNQSIRSWDVSSVTDMSHMFRGATAFNQYIGDWDVSNVTDMSGMFLEAGNFNRSITNWDVSSVTDMNRMFSGATNFNVGLFGSLNSWDVSNVTDMSYMFVNAVSFTKSINNWDVSSVTNMSVMFAGAENFNSDISNWDVSSVTDMYGMFSEATIFNQPIGGWDVSSVIDMSYMFHDAENFNADLNSWDVSSVTDMGGIFRHADSFNGDISSWDVSSITDMSVMFQGASDFNRDISSWDVSKVTNMSNMFAGAESFNMDIGGWDVSNVADMSFMFDIATSFNQDISSWCVTNIDSKPYKFDNAAGFEGNSSLQPQWGTCP